MAKPQPNWNIWLHMPRLKTNQAVSLSFGVDPSRVHTNDRGGRNWGCSVGRYFETVAGFEDRRILFSACHPAGLSVLEFAKWAQAVGWNIPLELARLAPVPVDAPDALSFETVHSALLGVIAPSGDIEELKAEIARLGVTFTMHDGVETIEIPDGNVRGKREPLTSLYHELSFISRNGLASKIGTLLRSSGAQGGGALGSSYSHSYTPKIQAPPPTALVARLEAAPAPVPASPAPVMPAGPNRPEAWVQKARCRAVEIIEAERARDLYPSQDSIADQIAREFRAAGVMGVGGKPMTGSYIKRHALKGISSEQGKRLSTSTSWGK